jgi:hypothetical protein
VIAERYQVMPQRYVGKKTEMIWIETGNRSAYRTMAMGASEMFGWINRQETLKFLDTVIKNGYNTES